MSRKLPKRRVQEVKVKRKRPTRGGIFEIRKKRLKYLYAGPLLLSGHGGRGVVIRAREIYDRLQAGDKLHKLDLKDLDSLRIFVGHIKALRTEARKLEAAALKARKMGSLQDVEPIFDFLEKDALIVQAEVLFEFLEQKQKELASG